MWAFKRRIQQADGVIFSTPEYDHSIPAALKSAIEWLSYHCTVLYHKPAMVVGVSYGIQASSRAQEHIRQILAAPDCSAYVLPGHEVLIGQASDTFTKNGNLAGPKMVADLECKFNVFVDFVSALGHPNSGANPKQRTEPSIDTAYVSFPTGRLSLREIQQIMNTIPFEMDFIDGQDNFAWFSDKPNREHQRTTRALGQPVKDCHPPKVVPEMEGILNVLKSGQRDVFNRPVVSNGHRVLIQYYAVRDTDGHYLGTLEFTGNVEYILQMAENGAWGAADASTGASQSGTGFDDTTSSASQHNDDSATDASTGASEHGGDDQADASTSASQSSDNDADASTGASQHGGNDAEPADASTGASQSNDNAGETDASTGASQHDDSVSSSEVKHDVDRDGLPDFPPMAHHSSASQDNQPDASTGASQK